MFLGNLFSHCIVTPFVIRLKRQLDLTKLFHTCVREFTEAYKNQLFVHVKSLQVFFYIYFSFIFLIIEECNRTYYGNVGLTYGLELHRPKEDKIPYVCVMTFTASGGIHGDIVQVSNNKIYFIDRNHYDFAEDYIAVAVR